MFLQKSLVRNSIKTLKRLYAVDLESPSIQRVTKVNTIITMVPQGFYFLKNLNFRQGELYVIERFGKFHQILEPGLNFILPVIDSISYVHSTKEIAFPIKSQTAITKDNVQIQIDGRFLNFLNFSSGVVYIKIIDAKKASYEVENPFFAISNLAQTTMRAEIGKIILDKTFSERQALNSNIVNSIEKVAANWGISIERYEIKDVKRKYFLIP
jgi:regulator of protease activity HflC (stomatin/prohibitin superfamily)